MCSSRIHWNHHHRIEYAYHDSSQSHHHVPALLHVPYSMSTVEHFNPVRVKWTPTSKTHPTPKKTFKKKVKLLQLNGCFLFLSCQNAFRIQTSLLWWCLQAMQECPSTPIRIPSWASGIHWNHHHLIEPDYHNSGQSQRHLPALIQGFHGMTTFEHFSPIRVKWTPSPSKSHPEKEMVTFFQFDVFFFDSLVPECIQNSNILIGVMFTSNDVVDSQ